MHRIWGMGGWKWDVGCGDGRLEVRCRMWEWEAGCGISEVGKCK